MTLLTALRDEVVIEPFAWNEKRESGLIVPHGFGKPTREEIAAGASPVLPGIVLSVGPDCRELEPFDSVMYIQFKSVLVTLNYDQYVIIGEEHVVGRFKRRVRERGIIEANEGA